MKTIGTNLFI